MAYPSIFETSVETLVETSIEEIRLSPIILLVVGGRHIDRTLFGCPLFRGILCKTLSRLHYCCRSISLLVTIRVLPSKKRKITSEVPTRRAR